MPFIADSALDAALEVVRTATRLDICSAEPTTYTQATSTLSLQNKTGITMGAVGDRTPNGRKTTCPAQASGATATASGSGTHWALSLATGSVLLATGANASAIAITAGVPVPTNAFDVGLADAVTG